MSGRVWKRECLKKGHKPLCEMLQMGLRKGLKMDPSQASQVSHVTAHTENTNVGVAPRETHKAAQG